MLQKLLAALASIANITALAGLTATENGIIGWGSGPTMQVFTSHQHSAIAGSRAATYHVVENQTFFNCDSAADCKTDTDAVDVEGWGTGQGWTYTAYACPHALNTDKPTASYYCDSATYGTTGYAVAKGGSGSPSSHKFGSGSTVKWNAGSTAVWQ